MIVGAESPKIDPLRILCPAPFTKLPAHVKARLAYHVRSVKLKFSGLVHRKQVIVNQTDHPAATITQLPLRGGAWGQLILSALGLTVGHGVQYLPTIVKPVSVGRGVFRQRS